MSSKSKMLAGARALLWLDLETTGTDLDLDEIIEIGAILTDLDLNIMTTPDGDGEFNIVVRPSAAAMGRLLRDEVVRPMHEANGLLDECASAKTDIGSAGSAMLTWLAEFGLDRPKSCMIAGSGVGHFDRQRVDKWMPGVAATMVYPPMDIGVVRRFLRLTGLPMPDASERKNHRALDDAHLHLEEAKSYSRTLVGHFDALRST